MFRTGARLRGVIGLAVAAGGLAAVPSPAAAQYFGRNKVQYQTFDFRVLKTEHFDLYYYPEEAEAVKDAARMAERWYTRHTREFNHQLSGRRAIVIYANHPDFQQTNVVGGELPEETGGVTEGLRNRVVLPFTGVYADNDHVLGHELVHVFQYDVAESPTGGGLGRLDQLPLWLIEGMAEYLSLGRENPLTAMWLRDAALQNRLPTIKQLTNDPRFFPYRYGQALWAYIGGKWGDEMVPRLYRNALSVGWDPAIRRMLGMTSDSLSKEWIAAIRTTYTPLIQGRTAPKDAGERILATKQNFGDFNLAPVLSPDGKYVAFFSQRSLFSIDLFVADARTGKVIKKLASPGADAHTDALSFIYSAGTWSPDGKRLAYITFAQGDNEIEVLDVERGRVVQRIHPQDIGAISNVAWSPDGNQLAFSGMQGGLSDLFLFDFQSKGTRRLTNDRNADLQPTWSPDGKTIVFVTDRGPGTDFDKLTYSPMRLALMDVASGAVRLLTPFEGAKHINPQFSPDGKDLYFISDRGGFSDIYRMTLESGELYQVTRLATGASGITELSPAMSIAQQTGRMLFSVFEGGGYRVYGLDADKTRGERVTPAANEVATAGVLPPIEARERGSVSAYLRDPSNGLPAQTEFPTTPYKANLSLEAVGQPSLGVGTGQFGTTFAGGASAYFGDMLGNRTLGVVLQANGQGVRDIGGQVSFLNAERRLNWLASIGHIPYITGYAAQGLVADAQGRPLVETDYILQHVYLDQASLAAQYPLSQTRRFEVNAGYLRESFSLEVQKYLSDPATGATTQSRNVQPGPSYNLFQTGAAYVGDNSFMGFTSPISGTRFRYEASPTFGTLSYVGMLADYRRYFFAKPFTLAVRGLHYGRYGKSSDDRLQVPIFLGDPALVRGYSFESFDPQRECTQTPSATYTGCIETERLIGSRIAVANAEFRIPLFGTEQFGLFRTNILPVEIAPFVDAGVAWTNSQDPVFKFSRRSLERVPVVSAGLTTRVNLLGYIVVEIFYAKPFQRPNQNHVWGFQLSPGW